MSELDAFYLPVMIATLKSVMVITFFPKVGPTKYYPVLTPSPLCPYTDKRGEYRVMGKGYAQTDNAADSAPLGCAGAVADALFDHRPDRRHLAAAFWQ